MNERFSALESNQNNDIVSILDSLNTIQAEHNDCLQKIDDRFDAHETSVTASLADIGSKQTTLESSISGQHSDIVSIIESLNTIQAEHDDLSQEVDAHKASLTASFADRGDKQTALESILNTRVDELKGQCSSSHQALLATYVACCSHVEFKYKDCTDIRNAGCTVTRVYKIYPTGFETTGVAVLCDMTTQSRGWTVFQRRESATDFYKTWIEYENGFGSIGTAGNFWLGNSKIHAITSQGTYEVRIDLVGDATSGLEHGAAIYQNFNVGDAASKYTLTIGAYSYDVDYPDPGDSLTYHNGIPFSTHDNFNEETPYINCNFVFTGAWWYKDCPWSNLNGDWGNTNLGEGPLWFTFFYCLSRPMSFTQMMIRRTGA